jgi:hypothetical protein
MEQLGVPGAAVGITHEGREEVAGLGVTSVEDGRLVQHDRPRGGFPRKDSPPQPPPPPSPLAFYEPDRVYVTEGMFKGARSEFLRDSDGRLAWYRAAGRVLRRTG